MQLTALLAAAIMLASSGSGVLATLDPCSSNTKGACPSSPGCSATRISTDIQAAECAHNTRTHDTQTFAVFTTDHDKDDNHGAPYGTCEAYTCTAPTTAEMSDDADCWTFFWEYVLLTFCFSSLSRGWQHLSCDVCVCACALTMNI